MIWKYYEQEHDKTNTFTCTPSKVSDQPVHLPSLISVFAVHPMGSHGPTASSCKQQRLWSDWADAQVDLRRRWAHIILFVLLCSSSYSKYFVDQAFILWHFWKILAVYKCVSHYIMGPSFYILMILKVLSWSWPNHLFPPYPAYTFLNFKYVIKLNVHILA